MKISSTKRLIISGICIACSLAVGRASAQGSLLKKTIDKLESYKNYSYQYIDKRLDDTVDTTVIHQRDLLLKAPSDKTFGYLFKLATVYKTEKFTVTNVYDGKNSVRLMPDEKAFQMERTTETALTGTLTGMLKWLSTFSEKKPGSLSNAGDTIVTGKINIHLIVTTYDTVINKEHYYTRKHVLINKQSGLPAEIKTISRNNSLGTGISDYYDDMLFSDYKLNQPNVSTAAFAIPKGYQPYKQPAPMAALLSPGTIAPDWTLSDANGKKVTLSELKGKVVFLDFYFIGCSGCMASLKPLNALYEEYKNEGVVIASITERDKQQAVLAFEKRYNINYPGYLNAAGVVKAYHVSAFPTFYIIGKDGKIASVLIGYSDEFEAKASAAISELLN